MRANFALYLTVDLDELLVNREEGPERWAPLSGVADILDPIAVELLLGSRFDAPLLYCRGLPGSGRAIFYPILPKSYLLIGPAIGLLFVFADLLAVVTVGDIVIAELYSTRD